MHSRRQHRLLALSAIVLALSFLVGLFVRLSTFQLLFWSPLWVALSLGIFLASNIALGVLLDDWTDVPQLEQLRKERLEQAFTKLKFTSPAAWEAASVKARWAEGLGRTVSMKEQTSAWRKILELVKRDYILPWYSRITTSHQFLDTLDNTIDTCVASIFTRIDAVDIPDFLVTRIVPHVTKHMRDFRQVEPLLRPTISTRSHPGPTLNIDPAAIIQSHFPPLHPALPLSSLTNTTPSIEAHIRVRMGQALELLLPENEKAETVRTIAREVLTCAVMVPVLEMFSEPDFWNRVVDEQAGKYLHEREQVTRLRAALDSTATTPPIPSPSEPSDLPMFTAQEEPLVPTSRRNSRVDSAISSSTDAKHFDLFLKSINKIKSLAEAKRMKNDIDREFRRTKADIEVYEKNEGSRPKDLVAHLERMEHAEAKIAKRIKSLSVRGPEADADKSSARRWIAPTQDARPQDPADKSVELLSSEHTTLRDILLNPSALGYFMEFMDRRQQSRLVQFWVTVESFKDPLVEVESSDDGNGFQVDSLQYQTWPTAAEDVSMIWETYLSPTCQGGPIVQHDRLIGGIWTFVHHLNDQEDDVQTRSNRLDIARRGVFQLQKESYRQLEEDHFSNFVTTELYIKAATEINKAGQTVNSLVASGPQPAFRAPPSHPSSSHRRASPVTGKSFPAWRPFKASVDLGGPRRASAEQRKTYETQSSALSSSVHGQVPEPTLILHKARSWSISVAGKSAGPQVSDSALGFLVGPAGPESQDDNGKHPSLFGDTDHEMIASILSTESLLPNGRLPDEDGEQVESERIEALQAALTSIIDSPEQDDQAIRPKRLPTRNSGHELLRAFTATSRASSIAGSASVAVDKVTADTSSLSLESAATTAGPPGSTSPTRPKKVFDDQEDGEMTLNSMGDNDSLDQDPDPGMMQLAGPGDLFLAPAILRLERHIAKLADQDNILDKMIRAAELTGKQHELALLTSSQKDLRREKRTVEFQKKQFIEQQRENLLVPNRVRVLIPKTMTSIDNDRQVVRYIIEVQQFGEQGVLKHVWVVPRRYNEFWDLHQELKESYVMSGELRRKGIDLPGKKLVTSLSDTLIEQRRLALEDYLKRLLTSEAACQHAALCIFLSRAHGISPSSTKGRPAEVTNTDVSTSASRLTPLAPPQKSFVRNLYRSVTTSLDDILLAPTVLDVLSEKLNKQATGMADDISSSLIGFGAKGLEFGNSYLGSTTLGASLLASQGDVRNLVNGDLPQLSRLDSAFSSLISPLEGESGAFTAPICDMIMELFDLKDGNWLRKQTIVMLMQQLLGGTIERKVRDTVKSSLSPWSIDGYLSSLTESMWPGGGPRPASIPRTAEEQMLTKARASRKIQTIVPDVAANMLGRSNARRATGRIHAALQVRILCQHLILTIFDEIFHALFPEVKTVIHTRP